MYRALLVAQREFLENIRTKGFWLSILMMPIMLSLVGIVPVLVSSTRDAQTYTVIDHSGWLKARVETEIELSDIKAYLRTDVREDYRTPLDKIKPELASQEDAVLNEVAKAIYSADTLLSEEVPRNIIEFFQLHRSEINSWWRQLSVEDKSELSNRISTNHFVYETRDQNLDSLNDAIASTELFAYLVIGEDPVASNEGFRFVSNNLTDRELLNWYSRHATKVIRQERLKAENINADVAAWISTPTEFESRQIDESGQEEEVDSTDVVRQWAPVVFVYLLWISIFISVQMLLTNTIEEKSNKLIEVLLSSISPLALMTGKILGIALTGMSIIGSWGLMAIAFFLFIPKLVGIEIPIDMTSVAVDPWFLGSFFIYFILGYLLYAAILVGLGSVCNNLKEAQNLMLPVQFVQMLPILLMIPIGRDPNGTLAQVLSYIPPLTPFVMMNRAAGPPSTFEYIVTTLLLVVSVLVALWFAAKIFRIGILLTGKPPGFMQIMMWLRTPVTDVAVPAITPQSPTKESVPK